MSPPPMIVPNTQAAFIFKQNHHLYVPATSQNFGQKPKATTKGDSNEPPVIEVVYTMGPCNFVLQ